MSQFSTMQNKGEIWNLMFEAGVFQGINDDQVQNVKNHFDAKVSSIAAQSSDRDDLTTLNKTVITQMMNDVKKYKLPNTGSGPRPSAGGDPKLQLHQRGTAKEASDQRQKLFQKGLETRQNNFSDMMNQKKPDTIDFSDQNDKPIGAEMDNMVEKFIAARESQLNVVLDTQDSKQAGEWINKDNVNTGQHIKIGDDAKLDTSNIVEVATTPRQVTFAQDKPSSGVPDFFNKLKKKPDDIAGLHDKLDRILNRQDEIFSLLKKSDQPEASIVAALEESDDGERRYNDDRNWDGGLLTAGT
jgi:hypothetical protein